MRLVRISVLRGARIRRALANPRYGFVLGLGRSKGGVVAKCQKMPKIENLLLNSFGIFRF